MQKCTTGASLGCGPGGAVVGGGRQCFVLCGLRLALNA